MNKRSVIGIILLGLFLLSSLGASSGNQSLKLDTIQSSKIAPATESIQEKTIATCDGINTTTDCTLDGISYSSYIYHPGTAAKTHVETVTTYKEETADYCTLCNDGTYSPTCATGRGACSHHGGVAEWNAPRSRTVPIDKVKTVIDAPKQKAYYEKVLTDE